MANRADDTAATPLHEARCIRYQRVAKGVVGGDEEPGAVRRRQRPGDADRLAVGVPHPEHTGLRRAVLVGEPCGAAGEQGDAVLLLHQVLDGELHRGLDDIRHRVDAVDIDPFADDADGDIRLVLMIRGQDLDRHPGAFLGQAIVDGHLRGDHRAASALGGEAAGHVGDDADLHRLGRRRGLGAGGSRHRQQGREAQAREQPVHGVYSAIERICDGSAPTRPVSLSAARPRRKS